MSGQSTPHENGLLKDYERPWKMNNAIELHLVNITIEILVVFSLFDMGLRLNLRDALQVTSDEDSAQRGSTASVIS